MRRGVEGEAIALAVQHLNHAAAGPFGRSDSRWRETARADRLGGREHLASVLQPISPPRIYPLPADDADGLGCPLIWPSAGLLFCRPARRSGWMATAAPAAGCPSAAPAP